MAVGSPVLSDVEDVQMQSSTLRQPYISLIVDELIATERSYVKDLFDVVHVSTLLCTHYCVMTMMIISDWWRRSGMFEHLRFYFNGFSLWCSGLILFCCTMVLLMTTAQSTIHCQTVCTSFCNKCKKT